MVFIVLYSHVFSGNEERMHILAPLVHGLAQKRASRDEYETITSNRSPRVYKCRCSCSKFHCLLTQ